MSPQCARRSPPAAASRLWRLASRARRPRNSAPPGEVRASPHRRWRCSSGRDRRSLLGSPAQSSRSKSVTRDTRVPAVPAPVGRVGTGAQARGEEVPGPTRGDAHGPRSRTAAGSAQHPFEPADQSSGCCTSSARRRPTGSWRRTGRPGPTRRRSRTVRRPASSPDRRRRSLRWSRSRPHGRPASRRRRRLVQSPFASRARTTCSG